ncbi:MAG: TetR/AcrR family transcriptional regulator [Microcystaceae cyanobacterium]
MLKTKSLTSHRHLSVRSVTPRTSEENNRQRILAEALKLFARKGYENTTTKDLAQAAKMGEGTLFRCFPTKKAILVEVVTAGWRSILTDLLIEFSEMANYQAIAQVIRRRLLQLQDSQDLLRICFVEIQFHPELCDQIQLEIITKMTDVTEAFFQTAIDRGIYRPINAKIIAQVFLSMFLVSGFAEPLLLDAHTSLGTIQEIAEGMADIFLHGVLNLSEGD